jgi:hypothetical protein
LPSAVAAPETEVIEVEPRQAQQHRDDAERHEEQHEEGHDGGQDLLGDRAPVVARFEHAVGRVEPADLRRDRREQELVAEYLDRAGGRARAAADQPDEEEQDHRHPAPELVVHRGWNIPCPR